MKKIILLTTCLFSMVTYASAKLDARAVITDCGTVHQIPTNCTDAESAFWLDYYTEQDCH